MMTDEERHQAGSAVLRRIGHEKDGKRVTPQGEQISVEFLLDEPSFQPHHMPFIKNLGVLGIEANLRLTHTHRSGRDTVDHGRNGHDDHANAVCGVLRKMSNHLGYDLFNGCVDWDDKSEPVNLPLGYTRERYEAELARRARIYANWGKTT
jgi:hypothetical protein